MSLYDEVQALYSDFDVSKLKQYPLGQGTCNLLVDGITDQSDILLREGDLADKIKSRFDCGDLFLRLGSAVEERHAIAGLELTEQYNKELTSLILDIDETLRTTVVSDNRIGQQTARILLRFWLEKVPIIISTGKGLGFVRGMMTQALGQTVTESDRFGVVYETGAGVYAPQQEGDTKQKLFTRLSNDVQDTIEAVREKVWSGMPDELQAQLYLEEKSFAVTLMSVHETHSEYAVEAIEQALIYLLRGVGRAAWNSGSWKAIAAYYADQSSEIASALASQEVAFDADLAELPTSIRSLLHSIDVNYYPGDAVELTSNRFDKATGVQTALSTVGIEHPFSLVMGDSRTDLRVMEAVAETQAGIPAAPAHANDAVLDHVKSCDGLVFDRGEAAFALRTAYAYHQFQQAEVV
ncbi:HAD hydrolase family protein [Halobellus ruber]|uniref:HAD hydrolase family protein n=1 Tax=Halobellus ruber TaxID=2761102 RepID=A0A7J9SLD5_9EURY|nr:HAD hydrolase family protein [Halobellus ruber]MBB6647774.1 HAD hydrolase family protein [Halobellus ruber]